MTAHKAPDRRAALAIIASGSAIFAAGATPAASPGDPRPAELEIAAAPPAAPAIIEHLIETGSGVLYVQECPGQGPSILLAHAATGSARNWIYQQAAFASRGFRIIAWSRRGHSGSVADAKGDPSVNFDIDCIADTLGLGRFHAIGTAAGGGLMLGYAMARPERIRTLVVACSATNVADLDLQSVIEASRPEPFAKLPADFRELGPCYRTANPDGVARWKELEAGARAGAGPLGPPPPPVVTPAMLRRLTVPTLWLAGDADLYAPPPLVAMLHREMRGSTLSVIDGAGHSAYWEQPDRFNVAVLNFITGRA